MLRAVSLALLCVLPVVPCRAGFESGVTRVNGVPLVIRVVEVRGSPRQVGARMLQRWRSSGPRHWTQVEQLRHRTVIAQRRGPLHVTAVLTAASRADTTRVLVSVLDLRLRNERRPAPLAIPGAPSSWLGVTETVPGLTEQLGFTPVSMRDAREGWIAALQRAGFVVRAAGAGQLEAERGGHSLRVFLSTASGGTAVVLQRREAPQ